MESDLQLAGEFIEAARTLVRAAARAAGPGERAGLTGAQMELLVHVGRNPDRPVAEVAERLQLARNTVSTLVGQLARAGLLARSADLSDGRVVLLRLEPAAEQRMLAWRHRRVRAVAAAMTGMDDAGRSALRDALPAVREIASQLESVEVEADMVGAER